MKPLLFISVLLYSTAFASALTGSVSRLSAPGRFVRLQGIILAAALVAHTALLTVRTLESGHAPMASMYETLLFYSWTVGLTSLIVFLKYGDRTTGLITLPMAVVGLLFAYANEAPARALNLILDTRWFEVHVTSSFAAYAFFTLAFAAAVVYLIKLKQAAGEEELRRIETIASRSVMWGFFFFSASMLAGAIWGYLAWGAYWMWEPKIVWSFIVWFYYAGAMHAYYVRKWRGAGLAIATALGIIVVLFTYLGVGMLMKSSHSF